MSESIFFSYLKLGWHHIISTSAFDHLSFIITLGALFALSEWKKITALITAFTIGHSVTLALSTFNLIPLSAKLVETLIPITILITAIRNVLHKKDTSQQKTFDKEMLGYYITALLFGFIHGMGFASSFRLMIGTTSGILVQLLAFNCGLELGQISVVTGMLLIFYSSTKWFYVKPREWNLFISGSGFGVALIILINTLAE